MRLLVQHPLYNCNTLVTVAFFLPIHFFVRLLHNSLSCSDSVVLLMSLQALQIMQGQPVSLLLLHLKYSRQLALCD